MPSKQSGYGMESVRENKKKEAQDRASLFCPSGPGGHFKNECYSWEWWQGSLAIGGKVDERSSRRRQVLCAKRKKERRSETNRIRNYHTDKYVLSKLPDLTIATE